MSIGHKGMLFAAKSLSTTMVDLFENEKLRQDIRKEFEQRKGDKKEVCDVAGGEAAGTEGVIRIRKCGNMKI